MENKSYDDFIQECNEFFERMNIKYRDIIENDSQCAVLKRVERKSVPAFNNIIMQSSTIGEVSIKFYILGKTSKFD